MWNLLDGDGSFPSDALGTTQVAAFDLTREPQALLRTGAHVRFV